MRETFEKELKALYEKLVKMGVMTEIAMNEAVKAIVLKDKEIARKIIENDDQIDSLNHEIEADCVELFVKQAPVAKDVRLVISILKMTTDIERIADHASDIAEMVLDIADEEYAWDISVLQRMTEFTGDMVRNVLRSFIDSDVALADKAIATDSQVNELYDQAVAQIAEVMQKDPKTVPQMVHFLSIAKYLERVGDHSKNIAEWVKYRTTGQLA